MAPSILPLALLLTAASSSTSYTRPELLIESNELAKRVSDFRVLDVRPATRYEAGHIAGAVRVDPEQWARGFAQQRDRQTWAKWIGATGIRDVDTPVVVCSDDVKDATRIWWILRYWGLNKARLLNGGWQAWQAVHGPVEKGPGTQVAGEATLSAQPARLATKDQVLGELKARQSAIIDTRTEGEYCGTTSLAKRGGSIPGAIHLEWVELIDRKSQRFKPPAELAKLFQDAGIDLKRPAITYCQSGGRASVVAFALELMGADAVRDYYRSWAEWGNAEDTPVARPKSK
jgi:thiosulfate/3-mercaptopyruvate sulfurtransferase